MKLKLFDMIITERSASKETTDGTSKETTDSANRKQILKMITEDPSITASKLATKIGMTEKGVWYHINKLKKNRIIKHIGSRKGGNWVIFKK
jgi:ATP-dependent DNA helicase RecG